jgi:hypothetical protein
MLSKVNAFKSQCFQKSLLSKVNVLKSQCLKMKVKGNIVMNIQKTERTKNVSPEC